MKPGSEMAVERAEQPEIDFVIFWVDGNDPEHRRKRQRYMREFQLESESNAEQSTDDNRFVQHDELKYCLRSIKQYAPWYRKIHLVTDNQVPAFLDQNRLQLDRIELVDHKLLFQGREGYLPTFNSRALAAQVHHLPGLSRYYLLGNDDIMLGGSVDPEFFFSGYKPVIYADWSSTQLKKPRTLWHTGVINGAKMQGFNESKFLLPSHGFLPFDKEHMNDLEGPFAKEFENNLRRKFRHESQFVLEALYNHYCLRLNKGVLKDTTPMVHFSFELCRKGQADKVKFLFDLILRGERKMFCLNEYQSLIGRLPCVRVLLEQLFNHHLESERG